MLVVGDVQMFIIVWAAGGIIAVATARRTDDGPETPEQTRTTPQAWPAT
jgi:hypothetical protein